MRLLIAPDSFKGSCSARAVGEALARGARRAAQEAGVNVECDVLPLSDGGEGFLDAIAVAMEAEPRVALVRPVDRERSDPEPARWLWEPATATAWGAASEVVAPSRSQRPSPRGRTARGVADYLLAMRESGARRIVLGIGGTSTVDGGASVAAGLGAHFERDGKPVEVLEVSEAAEATAASLPELWSDVRVESWCDVDNQLLGPRGAALVYGPQKGASPDEVKALERDIETWRKLVAHRRDRHRPWARGMGAGGGISYGVAICTGAGVRPGAGAVFDLVGFKPRLAACDWVWTGEGRLDKTTSSGKVVHEVLSQAFLHDRPAVAFAGQIEAGLPDREPLAAFVSLTGPAVPLARSLAEPEALLEAAGAAQMRKWLAQGSGPTTE